jgi:hypothetical protein
MSEGIFDPTVSIHDISLDDISSNKFQIPELTADMLGVMVALVCILLYNIYKYDSNNITESDNN